MSLPIEVFLSHSTADRAMAEQIAQLLRDHGIQCFFAPTNILGAQQWQNEILSALKRCDWFVVLLSPEAIDSMWVKRETAYALQEPRYENQIVPLMHRSCDLGSLDWLKLFQIIDFSGDLQLAHQQLLRIWGLSLKPRRSSTS